MGTFLPPEVVEANLETQHAAEIGLRHGGVVLVEQHALWRAGTTASPDRVTPRERRPYTCTTTRRGDKLQNVWERDRG